MLQVRGTRRVPVTIKTSRGGIVAVHRGYKVPDFDPPVKKNMATLYDLRAYVLVRPVAEK